MLFDPPKVVAVENLKVGDLLRTKTGGLSQVRGVNVQYTKSFVKILCDGFATSMIRKGSLISVYGYQNVAKPRFVRGVTIAYKAHRISG
jgi:hypothetical protein